MPVVPTMSRQLTRTLTRTLHRAATERARHPVATRAVISRGYCQPKSPPPPSKPAEPTTTTCTPTPATPTAETVPKGGAEPMPTIPDVQSTGLGLEDPEDDPKKWQKFVWKYLGSLVVFAIAYKTVGWYADSLEEEGRKKRDEVEERKLAREEYEAQRAAARRDAEDVRKERERLRALQDQTPQVPSLSDPYTPIQDTPGFISELDQLRAYRADLAAELAAAGSARKRDIEEELVLLDAEIAELLGK